MNPGEKAVRRGYNLACYTAPVRNVLSVSRDSRAHALRALPNTITVHTFPPPNDFLPPSRQGIIRYLASRDVIQLDAELDFEAYFPAWLPVPGFSDQVVNLSIDWKTLLSSNSLCITFPKLRYVFFSVRGSRLPIENLQWCVTKRARCRSFRYDSAHFDHFWPDLDRHEEWARGAITHWSLPICRAGIRVLRQFMSYGDNLLYENNPEFIPEHTLDDGLPLEEQMWGYGGVPLADKLEFTEEELEQLSGITVWPMIWLEHPDANELREKGLAAEIRDCNSDEE
ncbi:hypothetical protein IMZ48_40415 [Candidatus Bathyarchaeota archaeon]|nr:hypothetical protein [Candidatus Bathyarchaeota archaeon]